jgi:hypothetical protein
MASTPGLRANATPEPAHLGALERMGAAKLPHPAGALAEHLAATAQLLRRWGAREPLCTAGLFHSVYGTDGYPHALVDVAARGRIVALIGAEPEAIAYLFAACDRTRFHPRIGTPAQCRFPDRFRAAEYPIARATLCDLCELTLANEIDIATRNDAFRARHRAALSDLAGRMEGLASPAALRACRAACA